MDLLSRVFLRHNARGMRQSLPHIQLRTKAQQWVVPIVVLAGLMLLGLSSLGPAPDTAKAATVILYQNNFESPGPVRVTCATEFIQTPINVLYGPEFQQVNTAETQHINGPLQRYSDPSGIGGSFAVGMLESIQDDRVALTFNSQGYEFINVSLDISAIGADGCGVPIPTTPRYRISLYDSPAGVFNINSPGTLLDSVIITGTATPQQFVFDWTHFVVALDTSGSTDGNISVYWDLIGGGYGAFDNLVIAASDSAGTVATDTPTAQATVTAIATATVTATPSGGACSAIGFSSPNNFPAASNPFSVTTADLDGDGKRDLAVANYGSNNVSVLRNTSTSGAVSFAPASNYEVWSYNSAGSQPLSVTAADLDGDGKLDLAVANRGSHNVSVLRNTSTAGSISFAPATSFTAGTNPRSVTATDLDGDGKADLAVANHGSNNVSVLRNTSTSGSVSFAPASSFAAGTNPYSIVATDLDGDGKRDLAVANHGSNNVSVLRNTSASGSVSFNSATNFPAGIDASAITAADLDGDGKTDLAVANTGSNNVSVLRNTSTSGSVSFAPASNYATAATGSSSITAADLDGDGKTDLVAANTGSNNISALRNTSTSGSVSFASATNFPAGTNPFSIAAADLNGDGRADLATANYGGNNVSVLRNTCEAAPVATATLTASITSTATRTATRTATAITCDVPFTDVETGDTFYEHINCLYCRGVISGYPDGTFRQNAPITRGQIAKVVSNAAGFDEEPGEQIYSDVPPGSPYYDYINRLTNRDIVAGYPCPQRPSGDVCTPENPNLFRPEQNATRGQMAKIVSNAAGFTDTADGQYYADVTASAEGSQFYTWIMRLTNKGVMQGYTCGTTDPRSGPCDEESRPYFRPLNEVSRGQAAKIVANTFFPNCQAPAKP